MTLRSLQKELEADLEWREAELALLREMVATKQHTAVRNRTLFRAAWALLYAHYEGFAKFCLDAYVQYICKRFSDCRSLPERLFVFLIEDKIRKAGALPPEEAMSFFLNDIVSLRNRAPEVVQIDTQSNLWPDRLRNILVRLDLDPHAVIIEERKIRTLVSRRNDIAHGKKVFIDDAKYYAEYESAALNLMYALALAIVDRATQLDTIAGCNSKA